jgi:transcription elongation GreA/GreB family factor
VNKNQVRDEILARLREELAQQVRAAELSRDEAISEESRPENQYDMHSQEAAYLAEAQARMAVEIAASIELYAALPLPPLAPEAPASLGALVRVDGAGGPHWFFLGPRGGGLELQIEATTVLVLTPQSPVGRELLGKRVGDPVKLPGRTGSASDRVAAVL